LIQSLLFSELIILVVENFQKGNKN